MTKHNIDYSKTVIYKIVCNDPNIHNIYIGSSVNMTTRMSSHKSDCNNVLSKKYNLKIYQIIRLNGGWDNWSMVLIEYYPCHNNLEATLREQYYTQVLNSDLNLRVPGALNSVGRVEYHKRFGKQYRELNREKIRTKLNVKFTCECGGCYTYVNRTAHCNTTKHHKYMDDNYEWTYWWDDIQCTEKDYQISHYA